MMGQVMGHRMHWTHASMGLMSSPPPHSSAADGLLSAAATVMVGTGLETLRGRARAW